MTRDPPQPLLKRPGTAGHPKKKQKQKKPKTLFHFVVISFGLLTHDAQAHESILENAREYKNDC